MVPLVNRLAEGDFKPAAAGLGDYGGVTVSTGVQRSEQRADAPTILKMGTYKLKNEEIVSDELVAA